VIRSAKKATMATTKTKLPAAKKNGKKVTGKAISKKNVADSYNKSKEFDGQYYTGMQVGRSHKWNYDKGVWKETKVTPERWELTYDVVKRRAGHAPEGSGVPVGTGYHWFILSHQYVEKLNADDYTTSMVGLKFKLAHKRAASGQWSSTDEKQRKHLVQILRDLASELEKEPEKTVPIPLHFEYRGKVYDGVAVPVMSSCDEGVCRQLDITLNREHLGVIRNTPKGWKITNAPQGLTNAIGDIIQDWYE
jgi:hypothetical protein